MNNEKHSIEEAANFVIPHTERTAEREASSVLQSFLQSIEGHQFTHGGKQLNVRRFSDNGFDVVGEMQGLDHLEFNISNTGWGKTL